MLCSSLNLLAWNFCLMLLNLFLRVGEQKYVLTEYSLLKSDFIPRYEMFVRISVVA